MAKIYEIEDVHPAAAQWLTENGYTHQHEVWMPFRGRADFVAMHEDGHMLILECKAHCDRIEKSIRQVLNYCGQFENEPRAGLAVPLGVVDEDTRLLCKNQGVFLIELLITVPEDRPLRKRTKDIPEMLRKVLMELASEKGYLNINLNEITNRAHVAPHTLYAYFADKNKLLLNAIEVVFNDLMKCHHPEAWNGENKRFVSPDEPDISSFQHVADYADFYRAMLSSDGSIVFFLELVKYLQKMIASDLAVLETKSGNPPRISMDAVSYGIAGAYVGVIRWWLTEEPHYSPQEISQMMFFQNLFGTNWSLNLDIPAPDFQIPVSKADTE